MTKLFLAKVWVHNAPVAVVYVEKNKEICQMKEA
jgi:hypothetical protein